MLFENQFIYFPTHEFLFEPLEFGLEFEDIFFTTPDGTKLHGWYVPCKSSKSVMLFFHGNAGNLSDRLDNVYRLNQQVGIDVFIIDYHGYGKSKGRPNEENLCMDGLAAYKKLKELPQGKNKNIVIFGRSLGGAVAADLAPQVDCDAVILESTFTSIPDVANTLIPYIPAGKMLKTKFESIKKISKIEAPLLLIHGVQDSLIPFSHGKQLFDNACEPKTFFPIEGADHNDTYLVAGDNYFLKIREFIKNIEKNNEG